MPLYVVLALSLLALVRPESLHGVQRRLHGLSSLTVRWFLANDVEAADPEVEIERQRAREYSLALVERLFDRLESLSDGGFPSARRGYESRFGVVSDDLGEVGGLDYDPDDLVAVPCTVVDRRGAGRFGAGVGASELVLDRLRSELLGCEEFVTFGDSLVGFLQESGVPELDGRGRPDPLAGHARVSLLHHHASGREPRYVAAVAEVDGQGLRFLVEPAGAEAAFPLRCTLWSDRSLAAFRRGVLGAPVFTGETPLDRGEGVPPGLRIGLVRVFGYQQEGEVIPVNYFVEPQHAPGSLTAVSLWQRPLSSGSRSSRARSNLRISSLSGVEAVPVSMLRYRTPTISGRRLLAATRPATNRSIPRGAAVVDGLRLLGRVETAGNGFGVVSPFGEPSDRLSFVVVPRSDKRDVLQFEAMVLQREDDRVLLRVPTDLKLPDGDLFSGGEGPDSPPGLWIGPLLNSRPGFAEVRHVAIPRFGRRASVLIRSTSGGPR